MSRKEKTTTNQTTQNTLSDWSQNQWQGQFDLIQGLIGDGTYDEYKGPLKAGISGAEQTALDYVTNQGEPGGGSGYQAQEYTPLNVENDFNQDVYVNPHRDALVERMQGDVMESAERSRAGILGASLSSGTYLSLIHI